MCEVARGRRGTRRALRCCRRTSRPRRSPTPLWGATPVRGAHLAHPSAESRGGTWFHLGNTRETLTAARMVLAIRGEPSNFVCLMTGGQWCKLQLHSVHKHWRPSRELQLDWGDAQRVSRLPHAMPPPSHRRRYAPAPTRGCRHCARLQPLLHRQIGDFRDWHVRSRSLGCCVCQRCHGRLTWLHRSSAPSRRGTTHPTPLRTGVTQRRTHDSTVCALTCFFVYRGM